MKSFIRALAVLALAAGAFLFSAGWLFGLPRGTYIDGTYVGGLSRTAAVAAVRDDKISYLKDKRLVICADEHMYTFRYPEFNFCDDLPELVASINKKGEYFSHTTVYLNGAEGIAEYICASMDIAVREPSAAFNKTGAPFTYDEGCDGAVGDRAALLSDINASLNGDFGQVVARAKSVARKKSIGGVKRETSLLCSFSTRFDDGNYARSSNISLACSKINGLILGAGCTFSFNDIVGARTQANGFLPAKIISGGQFVEGVGGGVCQVSTTIYNAAILSGLEICEYHPHSLRVSYVAPSRDAMVSGTYFDLKFKNTRLTPIYVRINASGGVLTCSIYGEDDGVKRSFVSRTVGTIPQPDDVVTEGEGGILSQGREGTLSEGYIVEERDGKQTKRLIRKDKYAATPTIRAVPAEEGEVSAQNGEVAQGADGDN